MQQEKMTDGMAPNGDSVMKTAAEQPQQEWITPQFECIPLSEAMGPILHHVVQDGASLYS